MTELLYTWPAPVRLGLALLLFCGITTFIVWKFHDRIVALGNDDPWPYVPPEDKVDDKDDKDRADEDSAKEDSAKGDSAKEDSAKESTTPEDREKEPDAKEKAQPKPARAVYLAQRVGQWVGMAFVFLLAFTISNLWSNSQDAQNLSKDEAYAYEAAQAAAKALPAGAGRERTLAALDQYATDVQALWPLLQTADTNAATEAQREAALRLSVRIEEADKAGASSADAWSTVTSNITDMVTAGVERLDQLPSPQVPGVIVLLFLMGIATLAITAAYQSAPLGSNLVLTGIMAAVVALLLNFVVEISNPFLGGFGAVPAIG